VGISCTSMELYRVGFHGGSGLSELVSDYLHAKVSHFDKLSATQSFTKKSAKTCLICVISVQKLLLCFKTCKYRVLSNDE
jgi:hypothetical protein